MMRHGPAPAARAASIVPGSMVTRFCSTMRAMPKVAPTIIAKMAALEPIVVPTTARVSGPSVAMRMMNGMGRTMFTTTLSTLKTTTFCRMLPLRVV